MKRCVVLALVALLAACSGAGGPTTTETTLANSPSTAPTVVSVPATSAPTTTSDAPGVIRVRFVAATVGSIQGVSPDGQTLLTSDGGSLCTQHLDTDELECVEWRRGEDVARPLLRIAWTVDGTEAVFFDRLLSSRQFEAPLWRLDVESMELSQIRGREGTLLLDLAVSPIDGEIVILGRIDGGDLGVYAIVGDGTTQLIADAAPALIEWLRDGSALVAGYRGGGRTGLWSVDRETGVQAPIVGDEADLGPPDLVAVGGDGDTLLVAYRVFVAQQFWVADVPLMALVGVADGSTRPIVPPGQPFIGPVSVALSDRRGGVGYLWYRSDTTDGEVVLTLEFADGARRDITIELGRPGLPKASDLTTLFSTSIAPIWAGDRLVLPTAEWALIVDP